MDINIDINQMYLDNNLMIKETKSFNDNVIAT